MTLTDNNRCFLVSKDVVIPLGQTSAVILGRDPATCNYVLSDERVSRVHAMVYYRDQEYHIKDLNSSNGTQVNGKRVTGAYTLKAGDMIGIPPFSLEFVKPDYAKPADTPDVSSLMHPSKNKLEGSLATLSVTDLIQLLNATVQSGILTITDEGNRTGDLIFSDGEVVQAFYNGKIGEEAVFSVLRNRRGRFEFTKTEPIPQHRRTRTQPNAGTPGAGPVDAPAMAERQIGRKTQSLLMEGCRLMDERMAAGNEPAPPPPQPAAPSKLQSQNLDQLGRVTR